jgi:hypothetical protein
VTPEAASHWIAGLEAQLRNIEAAPARDEAEVREKNHRVECIRREIALVRDGKVKIGHQSVEQ